MLETAAHRDANTPLAPSRRLRQFVAVLAIYLLLARAGLQFAVVGRTVTLIWAPSGFALVAMLQFGGAMTPAVLVAAFLANAWAGLPPLAALAVACGNALEAAVAFVLLTQVWRIDRSLAGLRDVLVLVVPAALCATLLSAAIGATTLDAIDTLTLQGYADAGLKWWMGDMMGMLVVAPPLLLALNRKWQAPRMARALEMGLLLIGLAAVGAMIFDAPGLAGREFYASSLAVFPFVIWGALRFEQGGAAVVTLVVSALAVWGTEQRAGPFFGGSPVDSMQRWCAFAIVTAVTGLLLAASVSERRRAEWALLQSHRELERRVLERTRDLEATAADLEREMAEGRRLEAELIGVSERQRQALGRDLHDGLGQLLASLSLMCGNLFQRLTEGDRSEAGIAQRMSDLLAEATTSTRTISQGLYPIALEFGGLPAALHQLSEQSRVLPGLDCVCTTQPQLEIADALFALNLYRIAQEAVSNAMKHSRATVIRIELDRVDEGLRLTVADDGVGLHADRASRQSGSGLGLANMRFRAGLFGGRFEIRSGDPQGTRVVVTYPAGQPLAEGPRSVTT